MDLSKLNRCVDELNETWKYRYDDEQYGTREYWTIMREPPYEGDCEDYALTLLWLISDKSLLTFWWNLITFKAQIRRVITKNGGGHAILRIGDLYADNWSKAFVDWSVMEGYGHKKYLWWYSPIGVLLKFFMGKVKRLIGG